MHVNDMKGSPLALRHPTVYIFATLLILLTAHAAFSHRPVIVKEGGSRTDPIIVEEPEISWAYYGLLEGEPHFFEINSTEHFTLYVNILVPDYDAEGEAIVRHNMSFAIYRDEELLYEAVGTDFEWKRFYEKYGRDNYYWGPEYDQHVAGGVYHIKVFNNQNRGKYALAIGKIEKFTIPIMIGAMFKAQSLDRWFFKEDE
jgi:hypothetical protein